MKLEDSGFAIDVQWGSWLEGVSQRQNSWCRRRYSSPLCWSFGGAVFAQVCSCVGQTLWCLLLSNKCFKRSDLTKTQTLGFKGIILKDHSNNDSFKSHLFKRYSTVKQTNRECRECSTPPPVSSPPPPALLICLHWQSVDTVLLYQPQRLLVSSWWMVRAQTSATRHAESHFGSSPLVGAVESPA